MYKIKLSLIWFHKITLRTSSTRISINARFWLPLWLCWLRDDCIQTSFNFSECIHTTSNNCGSSSIFTWFEVWHSWALFGPKNTSLFRIGSLNFRRLKALVFQKKEKAMQCCYMWRSFKGIRGRTHTKYVTSILRFFIYLYSDGDKNF